MKTKRHKQKQPSQIEQQQCLRHILSSIDALQVSINSQLQRTRAHSTNHSSQIHKSHSLRYSSLRNKTEQSTK